jgi:hypothetical protein
MRFQIKSIFGFSIGEKDTAIAVVQRLLALLGLKLQYDRRERVNGKALRIYKGVNPNPDGRFEVFDRWLSRDSNKEVAAA